MGLAEVQSALARLATDPALRDRFFAGSPEAGAELRLNDEELASLKHMPRTPLEQFAESLRRKRRDQVRRTLPLTARALGESFPARFEAYLQSTPPRGCKPGLDDAEAFAASLERPGEALEPLWAAELARYELAWHRAAQAGCIPLVRFFRYPISRLVDRKSDRGVPGPRPTLACWWRPTRRGRIRHVSWSAPGLRLRARPNVAAKECRV